MSGTELSARAHSQTTRAGQGAEDIPGHRGPSAAPPPHPPAPRRAELMEKGRWETLARCLTPLSLSFHSCNRTLEPLPQSAWGMRQDGQGPEAPRSPAPPKHGTPGRLNAKGVGETPSKATLLFPF